MTDPAKTIGSTTSGRQLSEHTLTLPDGTEMFYRAWLPDAPSEKVLVVFHRGHESSGGISFELPHVSPHVSSTSRSSTAEFHTSRSFHPTPGRSGTTLREDSGRGWLVLARIAS